MNHFTLISHYDNGNEIDGTPGCPHVATLRCVYRCSKALSLRLTELKTKEVNSEALTDFFRKQNPDERFAQLLAARGKTSQYWYIETLDF